MRIVYVLTSLGVGGAERQALAIASRMAARGHDVAIMTLRPRLTAEWPTSLHVISLGMHKNLLSTIAGLARACHFLCAFRPDLIHSHSFHANLMARFLKLVAPAPVVLSTIHNVTEGGPARMLAYRLSDPLSRKTTAVSAAVAERFSHLKAVPKHKLAVVANGIDINEFASVIGRRAQTRSAMRATAEFIWLAAGRHVPAKDFPNLLQAFASVRAAGGAVQLWIAGEANAAESGRATAFNVAAGLFQQVRCLGLRRDLPALLDAADGFVLASAWEGMPLVVGEAMAMEKPIVATDVGGVRELMGDAGTIVPAGDSSALAGAMLAVMAQPAQERRALGVIARERIVAQFSMDARADEWEKIYSSVLQVP